MLTLACSPHTSQATRTTVIDSLEDGYLNTAEAIASSAVKTSIDMGAKMLVVLTESGRTAGLVAKYRPGVPILVLTTTSETARQVEGVLRGCHSRVVVRTLP